MMTAQPSWPEAAIAIMGIVFVTSVIVVLVWQAFATGRVGLSHRTDTSYRKLAEQTAAAQERIAEQLERTASELAELRERTGELERLLRTVE